MHISEYDKRLTVKKRLDRKEGEGKKEGRREGKKERKKL